MQFCLNIFWEMFSSKLHSNQGLSLLAYTTPENEYAADRSG